MPQGTTGTVALAPEVKALYDADFYIQGQSVLYWDQFADLKGPIMNGQRGISQNFPIIESLQPNPTVLDELIDVAPQQMRGSEVVITLSEYGNAIEVTKFLVATAYADVYKQAAYINGYNLAESYDYIARAMIGARATKMPLYEDGAVATAVHPFVFYDLMQDNANGGLRTMSQYSHPELLFNGELAYWGGLRMIVTANAKGFWGAGAAPASAVATTLASAANPGDTTISVAAATNIAVGMWLAIQDANEPGNTWSDSNELFMVTGAAGTTITGFALDRLGRFLTFGWYGSEGYSRTRNAWLFRGEVGSSQS